MRKVTLCPSKIIKFVSEEHFIFTEVEFQPMNINYWKSACIWTAGLIPELEKRDHNSHSISLFFSLYDIYKKKSLNTGV